MITESPDWLPIFTHATIAKLLSLPSNVSDCEPSSFT